MGNLKDIVSLVIEKLGLPDTEPVKDKIASKKIEAFYLLQEDFSKSDDPDDENFVENENAYKPLARSMFSDLISFEMIRDAAANTANVSSATTGEASSSSSPIKRAKADVVEAEFMTSKDIDGLITKLDTEKLMEKYKTAACMKARKLKITLYICDYEPSVAFPLIFQPTNC